MTGLELLIIAAFVFGIVRSAHHAVVNTAAVIKGREPVYVPQGYSAGSTKSKGGGKARQVAGTATAVVAAGASRGASGLAAIAKDAAVDGARAGWQEGKDWYEDHKERRAAKKAKKAKKTNGENAGTAEPDDRTPAATQDGATDPAAIDDQAVEPQAIDDAPKLSLVADNHNDNDEAADTTAEPVAGDAASPDSSASDEKSSGRRLHSVDAPAQLEATDEPSELTDEARRQAFIRDLVGGVPDDIDLDAVAALMAWADEKYQEATKTEENGSTPVGFTQKGNDTMTATVSGETTTIDLTRNFLTELQGHVQSQIVAQLELCHATLSTADLDPETLAYITQAMEAFTTANGTLSAAQQSLDTNHALMEQAVNDTAHAAERDYYKHQ